jgi:hypothetical protein
MAAERAKARVGWWLVTRREKIARLSRKGGIRIASAEGRGPGKSEAGLADVIALARESCERALRLARR